MKGPWSVTSQEMALSLLSLPLLITLWNRKQCRWSNQKYETLPWTMASDASAQLLEKTCSFGVIGIRIRRFQSHQIFCRTSVSWWSPSRRISETRTKLDDWFQFEKYTYFHRIQWKRLSLYIHLISPSRYFFSWKMCVAAIRTWSSPSSRPSKVMRKIGRRPCNLT